MKNNDDSDVASSPPNIAEEIDFNLVYALYAFDSADKKAAIVDQGEPLTLLDDSHIDWWKVKVLKNNKIGYIPADYVEFPYEKLARLNRHRNVNVASSQNLTEQDHLDLMNKSKNAGEKQTREVKFKSPEIFVFTVEYEEEEEEEGMEIVEEITDSSDSKEPIDKVEEESFEESFEE
ncbi:10332_t:CDS:2, partial [Acaulospora morrowiae]